MSYTIINTFLRKLNTTTMRYTIDCEETKCKKMNLANTKNLIITITTSSSEVLKLCPNTIIIQSSTHYIDKHKIIIFASGSGILLQFLKLLPDNEK